MTKLRTGLTRVAYGCQSFEDIVQRQEQFLTYGQGDQAEVILSSARTPRQDLTGGSIFWIVKHMLIARQPIIGIDEGGGPEGQRTLIKLKPGPIRVVPVPQRAHQGWRYITEDNWPTDLDADNEMPDDLTAHLASLNLL